MKIAILGTRGIPNYHGGFEQFAENFAVYLAKNNHEVVVYNSSNHPYKRTNYKGVLINHQNDPENKIGTIGQFIYDLNCIFNTRKQDFDIILQLGYTSNSVWHWLLPKKAIIVTNMDGLEWKRSKYSKKVRSFLKIAEKWAVKSSDYLIADSIGIQKYLKTSYNKESSYIAYGADIFDKQDETIIKEYDVKPYGYNMLIARMEPENNIEIILDGVNESADDKKFLVIGKNDANDFGKRLTKKYLNNKNIIFLGGVYNQNHLNNLRYFSNLYFHGHSVGGTNPSLLEAMASNALIVANDNVFNKAILQENAYYFSDKEDVKRFLKSIDKQHETSKLQDNTNIIATHFSWEYINKKYMNLLDSVLKRDDGVS